ncbi:hypothetical protein GCM10022258_17070 [Aquimarina gracilis]
MILTSLTTYGQRAIEDKFISFTSGGYTSLARYQVTSVNPRTVTLIEYVGDNNGGFNKNVTIPASAPVDGGYAVTRIGDNAFSNKGLTSVEIPNSVTSIGNHAFSGNQLNSVTIPNSVTHIGNAVFHGNQLTSVVIPESVTSIGDNAFIMHPHSPSTLNLMIMLGNTPPNLGAAFSNRSQIDVIAPGGTPAGSIKTAYEDHDDWEDFASITGEAQVNTEFTAGHITYRITEITPTNRQVSAIDYDPAGGAEVTIPQTANYQDIDYQVTALVSNAFRSDQLISVVIPNSVTSIGASAFTGNQLTQVTIPDSVTNIGPWAFSHNNLTSVTIPNSVTSISQWTFTHNNLTSVTIPNGVTNIGQRAFQNNQLTSVVIPESVTSIGHEAFNDNPELATVVSKGTNPPSIEEFTFTNANRNQIDVIVPKGTPSGNTRTAYLAAGWTGFKSITEDAYSSSAPFITTWKVGATDLSITIPTTGGGYNYTINWGDETIEYNQTGDAEHTYGVPGEKTIKIYGDFPRIYFNNTGDKNKILAVQQWGDIQWKSMANAFFGCSNLNNITATDAPNLQNVTDMRGMFSVSGVIGQSTDLNSWDVSNVTTTAAMFDRATNFNGDIGNWNVSNVTNMRDMFNGATNFNQDISGWNVSNVTNMSFMLSYSGLSRGYYGATLKYWADLDNTPTGITLGAHDLVYDCDEEAHRQTLMDTYGWEFAGDAKGDDQAPVLNLTTQQLRLYLDMDMATLSLDQLAYSAEDNCSEESELVYSFDAPNSNVTTREFGLDDRGGQTVTLFVSDPYGNAASKDLIVTVINTATDILSFTIPGQSGETVIDYDNHTVVIEVELGTDLSGLTPTIALSDGASANPESGVAQDFTNTVNYTVTAEDGTTQQVWRVTVEAAGSDELKPVADFNRGISPNGDGIADTLVIKGLEKYENNVVKIYNLSQRLLFSAHYGGLGNAWDCTHKGSLVPVGSYLCVIDFNDPGLGQKAKMIYVNY